ncbi:aminopeptidase P family N-terminal domain-containing protein [Paraclostridium benzoelyticum]|uniref:aminopeptidase P family N-terminal domain-containing protein n=1 Tax=Paraclostridium benzoelyticum TaxID=1629550 RepID=UPI003D68BC2D
MPSSDNHQSEYVGDYFKSRAYISGFTGSAGTLVVTMDEAGLWTDGRYFIQAENQLKNTGIKLFKMGEEGVPTTQEFICEKLSKGSILGFDGRLISADEGKRLEEKLKGKNVSIKYEYDLVDKVWNDRPSLSKEKAFLLKVNYAGETFSSKLKRLREVMKEKNVTSHIITTLDDIAWLFNIRGRDVKYTPVVLSYAIITLDEVYLFIEESKLNEEIINELKTENVIIKKYDDIYEFVKTIDKTEKVLLDEGKVSYSIYNNLPNEVQKINAPNPTMNFKAVKNNIELENVRKSHLKDGVAFTKFMYWLKNNVGNIEISEISASEKLEELRRAQKDL